MSLYMLQGTPTLPEVLEEKTYREIIVSFFTESWPFLTNRWLELLVDFIAMFMLSKVDPERESASSLILSLTIVLRSVNGSCLYFTAPAVRLSVSDHTKPLTAVGNILHKAWLFAFPLGFVSTGIAFASEQIFLWAGQPPTPSRIAKNFFIAYGPGLSGIIPAIANQQAVLGLSRPKTVLLMTSLTMPLVLLLGYPLIFGKWGFPELKETGLGIAYSLSFFLQFFAYLLLFKWDRGLRHYGFFDFSQLFAKNGVFTLLVSKGMWIGAYAFLELVNVFGNTLLIGYSGNMALSALQPSLQYSSILANSTFNVGHSLANLIRGCIAGLRFADAKKYIIVGTLVNFSIPTLVLIVFLSSKDAMLMLFLKEDTADSTVNLAAQLLLINILGQIADGLRNSASGILRGLGNTSYAFRVMVGTVVGLMLPFSLIAQFVLNWGPSGILGGRNVGIALGAILIAKKAFQQFRLTSRPATDGLQEQEFRSQPRGCLARIRERWFGNRQLHIQDAAPQRKCLIM